jgi:hypothetical protein
MKIDSDNSYSENFYYLQWTQVRTLLKEKNKKKHLEKVTPQNHKAMLHGCECGDMKNLKNIGYRCGYI